MKKLGLDAFTLKVIALISMTIDHIGYFLFPDILFLRIIGRVAFVIFAYFTANAYIHSSNKIKHGLTLLGCGLVFDIFTIISNQYYVSNIFITLAFGYFLIMTFDKKQYLLSLLLLIIVHFWQMDYGYYGVILIFMCYIFYKQIDLLVIVNLVLVMFFSQLNIVSDVQYYSCFGLMLLYFYNFKKGRSMKYLFYIYYPLHIVIIQIVAQYM
ncbi:TraX family protein [Mycoplasma sp. P36-A1]|uniref:TraX family protein n=1 Tax=Mycoplasma sp. P36-A1 TaxID=3252900 RepID=UPI003C2AAF2C